MQDHNDFVRPQSADAAQHNTSALHNVRLIRMVGLVRSFTGFAGLITLAVLMGEAALPPAYKPSMLIGSFHGRIEAADANAKLDTMAAMTRKNAEASAQPPAYAAMETEAFRQQQQVLSDAMQMQSALANGADAGCLLGQLVPRDSRDYGSIGEMLRSACGVGDRVRQGMVDTLRRGGQDNSVLIQRPRASTAGR